LNDNDVPMIMENEKTAVVGFPTASPQGSITRHQINALDHLQYWLQTKSNYAEHSVSCTIYYAPDEREAVKQWIFQNQNALTGLSFLPRFDAHYDNAPFVEIEHLQYDALMQTFPAIDFSLLADYDAPLFNTSAQEVSCSAGMCELT